MWWTPKLASNRERFEALALTLRDLLTPQWLKTQQTYDRENPKLVYYLSMEFLLGRSLVNYISHPQTPVNPSNHPTSLPQR